MKHHHHTGVIAFAPIALLFLASQWGNLSMGKALAHYEERAGRTQQHVQLLDTKLQDMQHAYRLLTTGDDETVSRSTADAHLRKTFTSPFEKNEEAKQYSRALEERVTAMGRTLHRDFGGKRMHIDLSSQTATLIDDGAIVAQYQVSSGASDTPTPQGVFQIHRKQDLRISQQAVPYRMPHYMAFTKSQSHGLHALPYLGSGPNSSDFWHEALSHIGIPVSHGCVRLLPEDAKKVYSWIEVGTPIHIST